MRPSGCIVPESAATQSYLCIMLGDGRVRVGWIIERVRGEAARLRRSLRIRAAETTHGAGLDRSARGRLG